MPHIHSINISAAKGTVKTPIVQAEICLSGIVGDAHAGSWHRQISLLAMETVEQFGRRNDRQFQPGEFAENLTTVGLDLSALDILDTFSIGTVELEVTQIGKQCHGTNCAIFQQTGKCVMPEAGIFTRVLKTGIIHTDDEISYNPHPLRILIITLSDRVSLGEYEDRSGPRIQELLEAHFAPGRCRRIPQITRLQLPDDPSALRLALKKAIAEHTDYIFTTGGTGIGPRDFTPEVVAPLLDKTITGLMEFIRCKHGERLPSSLLSRSIAGVAGQSLIYALPGSVKAVGEYLEVILPGMNHAFLMLHGIDAH
jgi:molybdenum cofactor synthesis domain-containing protein